MQKNLTDAAGREDGVIGEDGVDLVRAVVEQVRADAFVVESIAHLDVARMMLRGEEIDRGDLGRQRDVRLALHAIEQRDLDRPPGRISRMNDPRNRMRPFLRQIELALFAC